MKFAYTASDRYLGVIEAFVQAGWTPIKLFTLPSSHPQHFPVSASIRDGIQRAIPIQLSPIKTEDLANLHDLGCDALVVASYDYKIPDWTPYLKYGINFHPSPLPIGRGPYPLVEAVKRKLSSWGVTCHKLSPEFDSGDILETERFPLSQSDGHDILDFKVQLALKRLASRVANNFDSYWTHAQAQEPSEFWHAIQNNENLIDFNQSVVEILDAIRSFGIFGVVGSVNDFKIKIHDAIGWEEPHSYPIGKIIHIHNTALVVSAKDGFMVLRNWVSEGPLLPQTAPIVI